MWVCLHKIQGCLLDAPSGNQYRYGWVQGTKARQGSTPAESGHVHIQNNNIGLESSFEFGQSFLTIQRWVDVMAEFSQECLG